MWRGKRRAGAAARGSQVAAVLVVAGVVAGCGAAVGPRAHRGDSATATKGWRTADMTITPARGLSAGERVRVSVRGFPPSAKVFLSECARAGDVSPLGCGQQLAAQPFLITDGRGAASGIFAVRPTAATGPLHAPWAKCAAGPGCVLVATIGIPVSVPKIVAAAALRFAPPPTQPAPPASLPADAPLTVLRRINLPLPAWLVAADAGSLFAVTGNGPGTAITRVSPVTGRAGPSAKVSGAIALAVGGGMLWVIRQAQGPHAHPLPALALDPATLTIRHSVALPDEPGGKARTSPTPAG